MFLKIFYKRLSVILAMLVIESRQLSSKCLLISDYYGFQWPVSICTRFLRIFRELSFGIYMLHFFVLAIFQQLLEHRRNQFLVAYQQFIPTSYDIIGL